MCPTDRQNMEFTGNIVMLCKRCNLILLLLLHPFNGPFSRRTQVSRYQKDKTNLHFTEARDSEWQ